MPEQTPVEETSAAKLVAAVLAVMPIDPEDGQTVVGYTLVDDYGYRSDHDRFDFSSAHPASDWGEPEPLAAKYAATVLRWLAVNCAESTILWFEDQLTDLADEIERGHADA